MTRQNTSEVEMVEASFDQRDSLKQHTNKLTRFDTAVRELIDNANDWGATAIEVRFFRKKGVPCMSVIDDGLGMNYEGRCCAASVLKSKAREQPGMRGKNGLGGKGGVRHCRRLAIETKTATEPLKRISFDVTELLENTRRGSAGWQNGDLTPSHPIKATGTVITWEDVGEGDADFVNPKTRRTPRLLVSDLDLLPEVARKVTIVDEEGRRHALKPREIAGEPIILEAHGLPDLGDVNGTLYILPKVEQNERESLKVGAWGAICTWHQFIAPLANDDRYDPLLRAVRAVLNNPRVIGRIDVPRFKRFKDESSQGFDSALYEDEDALLSLFKWLRLEIVPKVEAILGKRNEEKVADDETFKDHVLRAFSWDKGRVEQVVSVATDAPEVSPSHVDIEPGQSYAFEIKKPKPGARYVWDASESGGKLDKLYGTRVTYTAGNETGSFVLRAREMGDAGKQAAEIAVNVMRELPFRCSAHNLRMDVNEERLVSLENVRRTSGSFRWDDSRCGGRLVVEQGGLRARLISGETEGSDFLITVRDAENPKKYSATITVQVERGCHTKVRPTMRNVQVINGKTYEFDFFPLQTQAWASQKKPNGPYTMIMINTSHPMFDPADTANRLANAKSQILLRIAEEELEGTSAGVDDVMARAAQLYTERVKKS